MQTLMQYMKARFDKETGSPDPAGDAPSTVDQFITYVDAQLAKTPIVHFTHSGEGLLGTLSNTDMVLLSPPIRFVDRDNRAQGCGLDNPNIGARNYGSDILPSFSMPITGRQDKPPQR